MVAAVVATWAAGLGVAAAGVAVGVVVVARQPASSAVAKRLSFREIRLDIWARITQKIFPSPERDNTHRRGEEVCETALHRGEMGRKN
jgi:hypothetical protein